MPRGKPLILVSAVYGWLPRMASCSRGQVGAHNSESFSERVLRCAGLVLTEGNTLLSHRELEILVVLRMNRRSMEYRPCVHEHS